jgi:3-oxoacyl-[acyl-carrier-protein] synthase II
MEQSRVSSGPVRRAACAIKRRVAVTGLGAVTPLGATMAETWAGVVAGRSPARRIRRFDPAGFSTRIAYEIDEPPPLEDADIDAGWRGYLSLAAGFGYRAALEAMRHAGVSRESGLARERVGVCLGVGMSSPDMSWFASTYLERRFDQPAIVEQVRYLPQVLGSLLAMRLNAGAGATAVHTACASSGQAVGEAYEMIAYGDADVVLTGGADSMISPMSLAGFCRLGALSARNDDPATASRPFDVGRDGFVLGEGATMLVLEELEHARRRGASILGEVCGYGVTASAYRMTDLHPEGRGPREAMRDALADAGLAPDQIGYVNAHGTSTALNDRIEADAIEQVFPRRSCRTRVSSTKSMTGHMVAAAGATELAVALMTLREQVLPPSINIARVDSECKVALTAPVAEPCSIEFALSNSVGFGGSNTALIAGRLDA